jgi:hypothetical protein
VTLMSIAFPILHFMLKSMPVTRLLNREVTCMLFRPSSLGMLASQFFPLVFFSSLINHDDDDDDVGVWCVILCVVSYCSTIATG